MNSQWNNRKFSIGEKKKAENKINSEFNRKEEDSELNSDKGKFNNRNQSFLNYKINKRLIA